MGPRRASDIRPRRRLVAASIFRRNADAGHNPYGRRKPARVASGGETILFTSVPTTGVRSARVEAVAVDTGKRQVLIEGARFPRPIQSRTSPLGR